VTEKSKPWLPDEAPTEGGKRHAPATIRNREAIADVLATVLPASGLVLEIASGSGEHAVYFAHRFPHLRWLPTDPDHNAITSIAAWAEEAGLSNLARPLRIDAAEPEIWPLGETDAILCINMVHISPWIATLGLLRGAARLLPDDGPLYLYGPYFQNDVEAAPSNIQFDKSLRTRDPAWGVRCVEDVAAAAACEGLHLQRTVPMPANNLSLIFRRGPHQG